MQFPIATFQKFTCSLNKFQHPCKTILVTVNLMNELVYPFFIADESIKSETVRSRLPAYNTTFKI